MNLSKTNKKEKGDLKDTLIEVVETFVVSFLVLIFLQWAVAIPEYVEGPSMEPTIYGGERVLVEKITKSFKSYERGAVVVLHPPDDYVPYIKRVIGVPGDVVKVYNCSVYISNEDGRFKLEEPYLSAETCTKPGSHLREGRALRLNENEYIVLGDNREHSKDSRSFGILNKDDIVGEVVVRFWPLDKFKVF